jgi:2-oxoglutarate ferredoxin oxidoreductase subunit beta
MQATILNDVKAPYCPGCGHTVANRNMSKALAELGVDPLDVIAVSDIGCTGLVDPLLNCHTIHGLHGRAAVLAMGICMGLEKPGKKVIALQGDGGATIGLQHLLEAARHNLDMTLVVQNNMVYGMTGGQVSGLSSTNFKKPTMPEDAVPSYDICALAHSAGAAFSARAFIGGDSIDLWKEALSTPGFCLLEVVEMCPAYGMKKVKDLHDVSDYGVEISRNERTPNILNREVGPSLLESFKTIDKTCDAPLDTRMEVIIAGSAGEAIQSAGDLLATAAITAGLSSTKKGDYPITIGTGFSVAEVILSRESIHYTGIETPDVMIIISLDGLNKVKDRIGPHTLIIADSKLGIEDHPNLVSMDFRKMGGARGAALAAMASWLKDSGLLPLDALIEAASRHKHGDKMVAIIDKATGVETTTVTN